MMLDSDYPSTNSWKMRQPHLVPLSAQAVAILKELHALTGRGKFLFPSHRSSARPMSNNAVNAALRRMGFEKETMTGHGFRAMARTILDEVLVQRPDIVEHQLAHAVKDPLGRAYNRTSHLPERRRMMQRWADYENRNVPITVSDTHCRPAGPRRCPPGGTWPRQAPYR
jgi:integrase